MPPRFWVLRSAVALFCLGFAFFWGRSLGGRYVSTRRSTGSVAWGIRTTVAAVALLWRTGLDLFAIAAYSLAAACWGAGFHLARRPREPEEDLSRDLFPKE